MSSTKCLVPSSLYNMSNTICTIYYLIHLTITLGFSQLCTIELICPITQCHGILF